jgi:hypothetical protein
MEMVLSFGILVVLGLAVAQVIAARGFRGRSLSLGARLRGGSVPADVSHRLPPVVRDFARRCGANPGQGLRAATITQVGEVRRGAGAGRFVPFGAWQVVALGRAGFLWDARLDAGVLQGVRIIDAFVDGEGVHEERWLGSVPTRRLSGAPTTLAAAYRYLGELPFVPDAILTNPALVWETGKDRTASVSLTTPAGTARVAFLFDEVGDIVAMRARGRPAAETDGAGETPPDWQGRFADYATLGPRRVPTTVEMGHVRASGYEAVYRVRLTEYHVAV